MKNNDDIPATDTTEIKQLIDRVKRKEALMSVGGVKVVDR